MDFRSAHFEGNGRLAQAADSNPFMKKGEAGFAVRLLQQALVDLGYPLPKSTKKFGSPDGLYGGETKEKVRKFQADEGLGKDGIAGEQTLGRMDELLVAKKIRFKPLPPLPAGSAGDVTNPDLDTQQAILETLGMPVLRTINFELGWKSKITVPSPPGGGPPARLAATVRIHGTRYVEIANAISNGRVAVVVNPAIPQTMAYRSSGTGANRFSARQAATMSLEDRAVIVHEATHAICDLDNIGLTDALFSEAIAFVAECLFFRKITGGLRPGKSQDEKDVLARADAIAQKIIGGTTTIDAADTDIENIERPLSRTHAAQAGRFSLFNGIP